MNDYLDLACTVPFGSPCIQVGHPEYSKWARLEGRTLINQIIKDYGSPPESVSLRLRSNPHDFGTYYTVAAYYDTEDKESIEYAFSCESYDVEEWSLESRAELEKAGYPFDEAV